MGSHTTTASYRLTRTEDKKSKSKNMKLLPKLCFIPLVFSAPQYSGDQAGLDAGSLDTVAEIFGTKGNQIDSGYGSANQVSDLIDDVMFWFKLSKKQTSIPMIMFL